MSSTDHTTNSKSALRKRCFFGNSALEGSQKKINTDFTSVSHLVMRTSGSRRCVIVEKKKPHTNNSISPALECTSGQPWCATVGHDLLRWARREHCCPRCRCKAGPTPHDPTFSVPAADHKPQTRLSKTQITPAAPGSNETFALPLSIPLALRSQRQSECRRGVPPPAPRSSAQFARSRGRFCSACA